MKQNIIFSFVFIAIIVGLVKLHEYSVEKEKKDQKQENTTINSLTISDIVDVANLAGLEERSDIPFVKLVDPELVKTLPDSIDYEQFRPNKVLLSKGFNPDDLDQTKEFSSITFSFNQIPGMQDNLDLSKLGEQIEQYTISNVAMLGATVSEWKGTPVTEHNNTQRISFSYKQTSSSGKVMHNILSFICKDDYQLTVMLTAIPADYEAWTDKFNQIVNSIYIR